MSAGSGTGAWTTPEEIRTRVRRRWDDGTLLTSLATGEELAPIDLPLRHPGPADIGEDLVAVQDWVARLEAGAGSGGRSRYTLITSTVGGRVIGRNQIPTRARVDSLDQAWRLLGVAAEARRFEQVLGSVVSEPRIREWVAQHPLRALKVAEDWPALLAAFGWLEAARGSGAYLREISAPGVDTKFVERHRVLLAQLLGLPTGAHAFIRDLGLVDKPATVRLRFGPGFLGLPPAVSEGSFRLEELARLCVKVDSALVVENEVTFLSVPVPESGLVVWGKGFEVDRAGALPWLREAPVRYWGDLDTHGFAILDQLRARLPQVRSVLMDRATLLGHRDRWVREPAPTSARLGRLTPEEARLYDDLVSDRLGSSVRLEQERIDWAWVTRLLTSDTSGGS